MGIFNRGKKKFECHNNQDGNGELSCESYRENADGTREPLANLKMSVDGMCNVNVQDSVEHEDGELTKLEEKIRDKVVSKCQRRPNISQKPEGY